MRNFFLNLLEVYRKRVETVPFISCVHFPSELYSLDALYLRSQSLGFGTKHLTKIRVLELVDFRGTYTFPCVKYLGRSALYHVTGDTFVFPAFEYISAQPKTSVNSARDSVLTQSFKEKGVTPNFPALESISLRELSLPNVLIVFSREANKGDFSGYLEGRYNCFIDKVSLESVKELHTCCFRESNIKELYAPNCEFIGICAFENGSLTKLDLPCCEYISYRAFYGIVSLFSVDLPSLRYVDGSAFEGCEDLMVVNTPSDDLTKTVKPNYYVWRRGDDWG